MLTKETGNPLSYWEGMPIRRLHRWITTWNGYVQKENEKAERARMEREAKRQSVFRNPRRM